MHVPRQAYARLRGWCPRGLAAAMWEGGVRPRGGAEGVCVCVRGGGGSEGARAPAVPYKSVMNEFQTTSEEKHASDGSAPWPNHASAPPPWSRR